VSPFGVAHRMTSRVSELLDDQVPFVHATVVRAQPPTSARPGDDVVVLANGSIEGFVGGHCAEESVRSAALDVLEAGEPLLLRILPPGGEEFPDVPGSRNVVNPCLSGGALEIFLEPRLPPPRVTVVGDSPIADAVVAMAASLGFEFDSVSSLVGPPADGTLAVIVASHGRDEPESIRAALDAGVGFVGLVASRRRGESVLEVMDLGTAERARVRTPVGLDIGARTAEEIALSIMAEVVRAMRSGGLHAWPAGPEDRPSQSVDPVCGMTVVVGPDTPHRTVRGEQVWFCSPACRDRYAA
jgi:xanthine dehydrogenase accessory factor